MLKLEIDLAPIEGAERAFRDFRQILRPKLLQAMRDSIAKLVAGIKERVHVVTGNLRRSWNGIRPEPAEDGVGFSGGAGSNADYAAAEEFGKHGTEQVRAHTRRVKSRDVHGGRGRGKVATGLAFVRAHSRNVNFAGHPYARPALADAASSIQKYHEDAVRDAAAEIGAK